MRVLLAGLGRIGQRHGRCLRELLGDELDLVAYRVRGDSRVIDDDLSATDGLDPAAALGARVHQDLGLALAERPALVIVANPPAFHVQTALAAVQAGAHVLVEKPLGASLAGVAELVAEAERRGVIGMVGVQLRQHPGFHRLREVLATGAVGRPCFAQLEVGEWLPGFHPFEDYRAAYPSIAALGGGVVLSQIHEIDLVHALFGRPRVLAASGGKLSALGVETEDVASTLLEVPRAGAPPLPVALHQDFLQRPTRRLVRVVGTDGAAEWNLAEARFVRWDARGAAVEELSWAGRPRRQLFVDQLRELLGHVAAGTRPEADLRSGQAALETALAVRAALDRGHAPLEVAA
ncbi:MAG: Gfo/Idh/MocA family oxidoreductase [Polyangiaceae bacterium]|nr:Gfo/Idh/MocA family oxidoreductase [Polyangiaceae bacterium]